MPRLYTRAADIGAMTERYKPKAGAIKPTFNELNGALKDLIEVCEITENRFYDDLKVSGANIAERAKKFNKRILEFERITNFSAALGSSASTIIAKFAPVLDRITADTLANEMQNIDFSEVLTAEEAVNIVFSDGSKDGITSLIEILNALLKRSSGQGKRANYFLNKEGIGLHHKGYITNLEWDYKPGANGKSLPYKIKKITFGEGMPYPIRAKIKAAIEAANHNVVDVVQLRRDFREEVVKHLRSIFIDADIKVKALIDDELNRALNDRNLYDLTLSEASLRGFMGEIVANIELRYFFGDSNFVFPVGAAKTSDTKVELPIDTVIDFMDDAIHHRYNIQVKNYNLKGGSEVTFKKSNTGENFIKTATMLDDLKDTSLSEALIELFAAFHFNQPFIEDMYPKSKISLEEYKTNYYPEIEATIREYEPLFQKRIDKLMKMTQQINSDHKLFLGDNAELFRNTFFKIERFYVPASLILRGILGKVENESPKMNTSFEFTEITTNSINTLYTFIAKEKDAKNRKHYYAAKELKTDAYGMSSLMKVHYKIKFDLSEIIKDAMGEVKAEVT